MTEPRIFRLVEVHLEIARAEQRLAQEEARRWADRVDLLTLRIDTLERIRDETA